MQLKNKTALVTGGNSGLGLEITKLLLKNGAKVYVLGRDTGKLQTLKLNIKSKNLNTIKCDLRNYQEIKQTLKKIKKLDVLINNAGIISYRLLEKHDPRNIKDIIDTNLLGTIYITRELLPIFKKQNSGTIINVASTSGLMTGGHTQESVYMASKFGISGFTEGLKKEMQDEALNIRILGFYPGGMQTEIFSKAGVKKDTSKFMDPKEIAKIIVFMLEMPDSVKMDHIVVNKNTFTV